MDRDGRTVITVSVPPELNKRLEERAKKQRWKIGTAARELLTNYFAITDFMRNVPELDKLRKQLEGEE
jgi:hypothetical protein